MASCKRYGVWVFNCDEDCDCAAKMLQTAAPRTGHTDSGSQRVDPNSKGSGWKDKLKRLFAAEEEDNA